MTERAGSSDRGRDVAGGLVDVSVCPAQTAGTPAWYYARTPACPRLVPVRRGGAARQFLSTAITTVGSDSVWIRII